VTDAVAFPYSLKKNFGQSFMPLFVVGIKVDSAIGEPHVNSLHILETFAG